MILLFTLQALSISCGTEAGYAGIGDFNDHFVYLTERVNGLGWNGKFGAFDKFRYSPVLQCGLFQIENFSADIDITFFSDKANGNFSYFSAADTLQLTETWRYYLLPVKMKLCLGLAPITFFSGFTFSYGRLDISANSNYALNDTFPKNFTSFDMGFITGLRKSIGRFDLSLFFRLARLDEFHRHDTYLYFLETEGYIYDGAKVENSHSAALDYSGIGINLLYRIF